MDTKEQEKVLQLFCGAVSHWGHQTADRKQVAAPAATQGNARVDHGAHVNAQLVLVSVELQQSWEISIAIGVGPKAETPLLWIISIAFVLGVPRLNNKKIFEIMVSNFFLFTKIRLSANDFILTEA